MQKVTKLFSAFVLVFIFFFLAAPNQSFASDNDQIGDTCTITINGVSAALDGDNAPSAPASNSDGRNATWKVEVALGQVAQQRLAECIGVARLAVAVNAPMTWSWRNTTLSTTNNSLLGAITIPLSATKVNNSDWKLDVELSDNAGACQKGEPLCRRSYIIFDGTQIENQTQSCEKELDKFKTTISNLPNQIPLNQEHLFTVNDIEDIRTSCSVVKLDYNIVHTNTMDTLESRTLGISNIDISYTPKYIGQHTLNFELYTNGECVWLDCFTRVQARFTKNFCVANSGQTCTPDPENTPESSNLQSSPFSLCEQIPLITDEQISRARSKMRAQLTDRQARLLQERTQCCKCAGATGLDDKGNCLGPDLTAEGAGIYTSLGCIPSTADGIVQSVVRIGIGISGGVALLMLLAGSFMLSTSQGEPKRAGEAKEMITSAVTGLLFIIFSVAILQFIGISLLRIPGFGAAP